MLQQFTTTRPFMGQSIRLALIAVLASNDQIIRPIRATTRQRDNMIDMVPLWQFTATPIAFALLPLILLLNILSIMRTLCISCSGSSNAMVYSLQFWILLSPLLITCLFAERTQPTEKWDIIRSPSPGRVKTDIRLYCAMCLADIWLLKKRRVMISWRAFTSALVVLLLVLSFSLRMSLSLCYMSLFFAYPTRRIELTLTLAIREEIFSSKGLPLFTPGALLQWYTIHDKGYSLSGLGCLQQRGASSCFPHYSINALVAQV
jgi:hypothetical protein